MRSISTLDDQKPRPMTSVNRHKVRALKQIGSNLRQMNNIRDIKDDKSETASQVLLSVNKLRSKTNFKP